MITGLAPSLAAAQYGTLVYHSQAIGLLSNAQFQKELGLDEAQVKKAVAATNSAMARIVRASDRFRTPEEEAKGLGKEKPDPDYEELSAASRVIAADYKQELASFLRPAQVERIRVITIRLFPWQVFRENDLRDELKMTRMQRAKVDALIGGLREDQSRLNRDLEARGDAPGRDEEYAEKLKGLNDKVLVAIVAVLDDAQKKRLGIGLEYPRLPVAPDPPGPK